MVIAMTGLLPAPHLHAGDGPATLHVHAGEAVVAHHTDHDDDHQRAFDHGDHTAAQTVDHSYDFAARFAFSFVLTDEPLPAAAAVRVPTRLIRSQILPTHDPPIRFTSSPAPPAVV